MGIELYPHQWDALTKMKNGCILNGGVGSGKSLTSIAYYFFKNGGIYSRGNYIPMPDSPPDLYIITTAKKRNSCEWEKDLSCFLLSPDPKVNIYNHTIKIDSWNNIKKYINVKDAQFIFDEQRLVGSGAWVKSFYKIARNNEWILLSATPGDTWSDYIPVFVANGFYKNKTDFNNQHVIWKRCGDFYIIERYCRELKLQKLRQQILVDMDFKRKTVRHDEIIWCEYDKARYKDIYKNRWNPVKEQPIENASELCYEMRRVCNSDPSRLEAVERIVNEKGHCIIFYNFNYELEMLHSLFDNYPSIQVAEYNGKKHERVPDDNGKWVYLVQYTAGAEGWNCVTTDTIIFFSQNYSYKVMEQASGRIDRLNTMYHDLWYYHLRSHSGIDLAIASAVSKKKKFNESTWDVA